VALANADAAPRGPGLPRSAILATTVAALGYLVDIYDLILFSVVRDPSLSSIGVPAAEQLDVGNFLMNMQMIGMLTGGILWGVLGDKRGRLSVLFGSILLYSLANIANGFVTDVPTYAVLRVIAGIGLAGELGAGITLVSELLDAKIRGYATSLIAGIGICGAILAVVISWTFEWRTAYFIGGGMGLALLVLRVGVLESGIFDRTKKSGVSRGNFLKLFSKPQRAIRYLAVVGVGVPIWYAIGILAVLSPNITAELGLSPAVERPTAVLLCYVGLALGDFACGLYSQLARSRKRALFVFLVLNVVAVGFYFVAGYTSVFLVYVAILLLGIANGYWAVFVTVASEQFGTNLRATATTTAPNFVRGSLVLVTLGFDSLRGAIGGPGAAAVMGVVVLGLAFFALTKTPETFGKDLDYVEH
jgi:putative MFS transporter